DSAFLFGSVGRGDASLTVNGAPVAVHPNGAWIAWVPLPDDTIAPFRLVATVRGDTQAVDVTARIVARFHPPAGRAAWIDTTSFAPLGVLALPPGEGVRLAVRAAPGATVRLRTPSGTLVPLVRDPLPGEPAWGERAFGTVPAGTPAVMSGRWNDQGRLQLARSAVAWVNAPEVVPLPEGTPPPGGAVGSIRLTPESGSVLLRVPLPALVPYQVTEDERSVTLRLYGVASDVNWMQYGGTDPLVRRMSYAQAAADELTITLELAPRVWGYRVRFDGRDLLLEIRRP